MEYKGKIKFYEETIDISFPKDFNLLMKKISEIVKLSQDEILNKIMLYYNDEDGDKVIITGDADYEIFINNFIKENENKKENIILHLELNEVKKISQEIINYKKNILNEEKIGGKDESNNEQDLNASPNIEQNEDSKSIILAPYNSYVSLNNSIKEEDDDDMKEINIMNDICQFEQQAQIANVKYEGNSHIESE